MVFRVMKIQPLIAFLFLAACNSYDVSYLQKSEFRMANLKNLKTQIVNNHLTIHGIKFRMIKAGSFEMGTNEQFASIPDDWRDDFPARKVYVSDFLVSVYEITQAQYLSLINKDKGYFSGDNIPMHHISFYDALEFIAEFNQKYSIYARLPFEAEWEYMARAGTKTRYHWGDTFDPAKVWYSENSPDGPHEVGLLPPNPWGLYDVLGNVSEWCMDIHTPYGSRRGLNEIKNPEGPSTAGEPTKENFLWLDGSPPAKLTGARLLNRRLSRVSRGGGWRSPEAVHLTVHYRDRHGDFDTPSRVGFRILIPL